MEKKQINPNQFSKKNNKFRVPKGYINIIGEGKLCILSAAKGGLLTQGKCGQYSDALWKITKINKGVYTIISKNGLAMENKDGKNTFKNPIVSGKLTKATNQKWNLHNVKSKNGSKNTRNIMIENPTTKKCIDVAKKSKSGNGYVQSDCLKTNSGENFRIITPLGKPVRTKKRSDKKKAKIIKKKLMKKITDGKKKKKMEEKFKKLKGNIRKKSIKKAKKALKKKIAKIAKKPKKNSKTAPKKVAKLI